MPPSNIIDLTVPPLTPSQREKKARDAQIDLENTILTINDEWRLGLIAPAPNQSPSSRERTIEQECVFLIKVICFQGSIVRVREDYRRQAGQLYSRWIKKPKGERGVIPSVTRQRPKPMSEVEMQQMLELLLNILKEHRSHIAPRRNLGILTPTAQHEKSQLPVFDDTPIPSPFPRPDSATSTDSKRIRDGGSDGLFVKKPRLLDPFSSISANTMPPPKSRPSISANTSFASIATSRTSSVFSLAPDQSFANTQSTEADEDEVKLPEMRPQFTNARQVEGDTESSNYSSSSFERKLAALSESEYLVQPRRTDSDPHVSEELSQGLNHADLLGMPSKSVLERQLHDVFLEQPASLATASIRVRYEITRVYLHANVSMVDWRIPQHSYASLEDYNTLWDFLHRRPVLKDKVFPERCREDVWKAASFLDQDQKGRFRGVVLSGSLTFSSDPESFWNFRLNPMKLDFSHRLGRRFGNERFMEIDMPYLEGHQVPKLLSELGREGQEMICSWLTCIEGHSIIGKHWKPFFVKPKAKDSKARRKRSALAEDAETPNRVYLFAVDGDDVKGNGEVDVGELLDCIRPISLNGDQSYLKLFSRTTLALSRNHATVQFERSQMLYKKDIRSPRGLVMTDGAGLICPAVAVKIAKIMGISFVPSGFQGRIGEAKGLWTVDYSRKHDGDWIEIYDSQRKWEREIEVDHPWQRTFEVIAYSCPLRSAEFNTQLLPLLMDCSTSASGMRAALDRMMDEGLERELKEMQDAQDHPISFRKFLRDRNSNIDDKLKHGVIPYRNAMPVRTDECLNAVLDAGFTTKSLLYVKQLARKSIKGFCDVLKENLKIKIEKSAHLYMVPDFWGVLEPHEVYISSSTPLMSDLDIPVRFLDGVDVLVARNPAHYPSDIQKMRAVFKPELAHLENIIVFSTKGDVAPADKLSGGDYDGDRAWTCWEPSIVDHFENAELPECPDLVKLGILRKDSRTYNDLASTAKDPTSLFLKDSFLFNMHASMLGICTNHKEGVCYTHVMQGRDKTAEARQEVIDLSTLLSNLVDQAKQGYLFNDDDWKRMRRTMIKTKYRQPSYKLKGSNGLNVNSKHIIDQLRCRANEKVETSLTLLHKSMPDPDSFDSDLTKLYREAKEYARVELKHKGPLHWNTLLSDLTTDLDAMLLEWKNQAVKHRLQADKSFGSGDDPKAGGEYMLKVDALYHRYLAIIPHTPTPVTQALLLGPASIASSTFALLKASALYDLHSKRCGELVWHLAGRQFCALKVMACEADGAEGKYAPAITAGMHAMLKPDAAFVKRFLSEANGPDWDGDFSVGGVEDIEDAGED